MSSHLLFISFKPVNDYVIENIIQVKVINIKLYFSPNMFGQPKFIILKNKLCEIHSFI